MRTWIWPSGDLTVDRTSSRAEGDHETVAHGLHFLPAVFFDVWADQVEMSTHYPVRGFIAATRPQLARSDDVGEQNRYCCCPGH
jgi:hypothetical protein